MTAKFKAGDKLWDEIRARAKKTRSLTACVGYVGRHPAKVLKWRKGDTLIADISEETVRRGICSAKGALQLLDAGVAVYQAPRLHAKVYLFGNAAIVCSANASESSMDRREAGTVIEGAEFLPVRAWVGRVLSHASTTKLDRAVLQALAKLEPKASGNHGKRRGKPGTDSSPGGTAWMLGTAEAGPEPRAEKAAATTVAGRLVEAGSVDEPSEIDWFYGATPRTFAWVKPGDLVVEWWSNEPYYPQGKLVGLRRCIMPVDLGARFGKRRYRLALTDRGIRTKRLSRADRAKMQKTLGRAEGAACLPILKATNEAQALLATWLGKARR